MSTEKPREKPRLTPLPDGPFLYENPLEPESGGVYDTEGRKIQCGEKTALCRCGSSGHRPFCDGSHRRVGFKSARETDRSNDRRRSYNGRRITIHDNRCICSHARFCLELPAVFQPGRRPWVDPGAAEPEEIISVIERCPSGALSYSIDGVEREDPVREPRITVHEEGPYELMGSIEVAGEAPWADGASKEHCVCCGCGRSWNKPFCDGTHLDEEPPRRG